MHTSNYGAFQSYDQQEFFQVFNFLLQYSSPDEAEETVAALDGVKWPSTNPKQVTKDAIGFLVIRLHNIYSYI